MRSSEKEPKTNQSQEVPTRNITHITLDASSHSKSSAVHFFIQHALFSCYPSARMHHHKTRRDCLCSQNGIKTHSTLYYRRGWTTVYVFVDHTTDGKGLEASCTQCRGGSLDLKPILCLPKNWKFEWPNIFNQNVILVVPIIVLVRYVDLPATNGHLQVYWKVTLQPYSR